MNVILLMVVLDFFLKFFEKYNSVILVGYNIKSFDCLVFFRVFEFCFLLLKFLRKVNGFLDIKLLFWILYLNLSL